MNTYSETFQNITKSIEQLLINEDNSLEIKQSATSLRESVQPCFKELKQSATRLKGLVQISLDDLNHAEDIWSSKPRIAQAPTHEIWEQLGELSGRTFRIHLLGNKCKSQAVERAKTSWDNRFQELREKWFVDDKKQYRKGVGWSDKEGFIKDIRLEIEAQAKEIYLIIKGSFSLVYQEVNTIQLNSIQRYIILLDRREKSDSSAKFELIVNEVEIKLSDPTKYLSGMFRNSINPTLEALVNQGWNDIYWEQVIWFQNEGFSKIEEIIILIFADIKLATQAIEQAIAFYNDFLERQQRYKQETLEQRQAERAWIDQQRRELVKVQYGIEEILN